MHALHSAFASVSEKGAIRSESGDLYAARNVLAPLARSGGALGDGQD